MTSVPSRSARSSSGSGQPFVDENALAADLVDDEVGVREPLGVFGALKDQTDLLFGFCVSCKSMTLRMPSWDFHQLEATVDLVQGQVVGDERLDVDLAREPAVDQPRHSLASLDPPERGAGDAAAGDQQPGHDVEGLALAGDAGDRAQAPRHPRGLDGLAHHLDVAGGLEGEVGAEPVGLLEDALDRVLAAGHRFGRSLAAGKLEAVVGEVDGR